LRLLKDIRDILNQKTDKPTIIYAHCEHGADRTGEFSGSYYIHYKNMTLKQALDLDNKIAGREIYKASRHVNGIAYICIMHLDLILVVKKY